MLKILNFRKDSAGRLRRASVKALEDWQHVPGEIRAILAAQLVRYCYKAQPTEMPESLVKLGRLLEAEGWLRTTTLKAASERRMKAEYALNLSMLHGVRAGLPEPLRPGSSKCLRLNKRTIYLDLAESSLPTTITMTPFTLVGDSIAKYICSLTCPQSLEMLPFEYLYEDSRPVSAYRKKTLEPISHAIRKLNGLNKEVVTKRSTPLLKCMIENFQNKVKA